MKNKFWLFVLFATIVVLAFTWSRGRSTAGPRERVTPVAASRDAGKEKNTEGSYASDASSKLEATPKINSANTLTLEQQFPDSWLLDPDINLIGQLLYRAPFTDNSNAQAVFGPRLLGDARDGAGKEHTYETPKSAEEAAWMDRHGFLAPSDFTSTLTNSQLMVLASAGNLRAMNLLAYRAYNSSDPLRGDVVAGPAIARGSSYAALLRANGEFSRAVLSPPPVPHGLPPSQMRHVGIGLVATWIMLAQQMGDGQALDYATQHRLGFSEITGSDLATASQQARRRFALQADNRVRHGIPPFKPDPRPGG
jgi:hypothetical protein